jgi:hypothetical protein
MELGPMAYLDGSAAIVVADHAQRAFAVLIAIAAARPWPSAGRQ